MQDCKSLRVAVTIRTISVNAHRHRHTQTASGRLCYKLIASWANKITTSTEPIQLNPTRGWSSPCTTPCTNTCRQRHTQIYLRRRERPASRARAYVKGPTYPNDVELQVQYNDRRTSERDGIVTITHKNPTESVGRLSLHEARECISVAGSTWC